MLLYALIVRYKINIGRDIVRSECRVGKSWVGKIRLGS